jgi:hypothetical protein
MSAYFPGVVFVLIRVGPEGKAGALILVLGAWGYLNLDVCLFGRLQRT